MTDVECRPGCGSCCDPVVMLVPKPVALADPDLSEAARRWIRDDLTPMPMREAKAKAPWMFPDTPRVRHDGTMVLFPNVFSCRHFDQETRLCGAWEDRPPTCRDYPRYGMPKVIQGAQLPPDCEYRADLGQPVEITRKPT